MVGALDGFLSTWSAANATFGQGAPTNGSQFDQSGRLRQMQQRVQSATPRSGWTGAGSDTYADANGRHERTLGNLADLDKRLGAEVDRSAAVVAAGRRDLDAVRKWVVDAAATVPKTAAGERMLYPVISKGSSEIQDIINRSHGDLAAIGDRIRSLGGEYQALGKPHERQPGDAPVDPVDWKQGGGDGGGPATTLDLKDIVQLKPFDRTDKSTWGPPGFMELVPGSGTWVPNPRSPYYRQTPVEAPLDLNDIEYYPNVPGQPKVLGPNGYMELVPGSGAWVPNPSSPGYRPHVPQTPVDLSDLEIVDPNPLVPAGKVELWPHSGILIPDPKIGRPS